MVKLPMSLSVKGELCRANCTMVSNIHWLRRSPSIKVTRIRHDDSTSNLVRHVKSCDGGMTASGSGSITAFAQGSTYTPQKFRMKIALWVSRRHRPFAIVEDDELVDIFTDLNNKVEVPSRFTVSRDVKEIFAMSRVKVSEMLKACVSCARPPVF
jgi:hypothetical protein